ncbi:putative RNA polymerase, Rpb5 [Rosa chinensis]|uniref:Putative RNA polymerase, Rpb5 n=1 Tax=Rosa chinensis TaxID=74649 RepID=A0A2P6SEX0_ROSCH|nr:putative RNA polymerase, Rpb5 [Rosa chinensis]
MGSKYHFEISRIMRLYRARKTVMQMLKDRDYIISDWDINITLPQFKNKYGEKMKREDLTMNRKKRGHDSDQMYVFFPDEPKVGVKTIKNYIKRLVQEDTDKGIVEAELLVQKHARVAEYREVKNEVKKTMLER